MSVTGSGFITLWNCSGRSGIGAKGNRRPSHTVALLGTDTKSARKLVPQADQWLLHQLITGTGAKRNGKKIEWPLLRAKNTGTPHVPKRVGLLA